MKLLSAIILFNLLLGSLYGQIITGRLIDSSSDEPLEYASIGVIGTPIGAITDKNGNFKIDVTDQPRNSIIRASMISYQLQSFTIEELSNKANTIKLVPAPTQLAEVVIKPSGKLKIVGTRDFTSSDYGVWGWVGTDLGKGREKGTRIRLGASPVRLMSLHFHVFYHSFDTSVFRLHVRNIVNGFPSDELLSSNIFIPIATNSGWADIDLSKYNLEFYGDIVLILEWVRVAGFHHERFQMVLGKKDYTPKIYFNIKKERNGRMYVKQGVENKWLRDNKRSASMYLTVQEFK